MSLHHLVPPVSYFNISPRYYKNGVPVGFVLFVSVAAAQSSMQQMNGFALDPDNTKQIRVEFAKKNSKLRRDRKCVSPFLHCIFVTYCTCTTRTSLQASPHPRLLWASPRSSSCLSSTTCTHPNYHTLSLSFPTVNQVPRPGLRLSRRPRIRRRSHHALCFTLSHQRIATESLYQATIGPRLTLPPPSAPAQPQAHLAPATPPPSPCTSPTSRPTPQTKSFVPSSLSALDSKLCA